MTFRDRKVLGTFEKRAPVYTIWFFLHSLLKMTMVTICIKVRQISLSFKWRIEMKMNQILMCPKHLENCHDRAIQDTYRCTRNQQNYNCNDSFIRKIILLFNSRATFGQRVLFVYLFFFLVEGAGQWFLMHWSKSRMKLILHWHSDALAEKVIKKSHNGQWFSWHFSLTISIFLASINFDIFIGGINRNLWFMCYEYRRDKHVGLHQVRSDNLLK